MNAYSIEQLADPKTYQNDSELKDFAVSLSRSAAQLISGWSNYTELAEIFLSGQQAERVHKSWHKRRDKWMVENAQYANELNQVEEIIGNLELPDDVTVTLPDSNPHEIWLTIPRDGGLMTPKVKRLAGYWDVENTRFVLPLSAAPSLPRVIKNWQKAYDKKSTEITERKRAEAERRAAEQAKREAEWARERAERKAQRAREQAERAAKVANAKANRIKVEAGQYQVGDVVHDREIKSFGKSWTERQPDYDKWNGTRYEEHCGGCGRFSDEIENDTDLCPRCFPHQRTATVCYAYFV